MPVPHFYANLDKIDKFAIELDMHKLAEQIQDMNYGVHRFLSHLIDVRRKRHQHRIDGRRRRGDVDIAEFLEREGDQLADGLEALLNRDLV